MLSGKAGEFTMIPAVAAPGPVVDTTGAGDSFYAGLLAGLLKGFTLEQAGRLGTAAGACCVTSLGGSTGGDGELAPVLARAAVATGVDGLFMEVHSDPANALSDGPNQIPLEFIEDLLVKLIAIHHAAH